VEFTNSYFADIGFRVIDVKNGKEKKNLKTSLDLDFLLHQLRSLKSAQNIFSGQRKRCLLGDDPAVEGMQVVFRPTICGSINCEKMETQSKSFKMCDGCREDDGWVAKRKYCGEECAKKDWSFRHRRQHQTWHMSLVG
jgi:hypothetical protein